MNMHAREISLIILLDMSKAFDNIRHDLLLSEHRSMGYLTVEVPASVVACPIKKSGYVAYVSHSL